MNKRTVYFFTFLLLTLLGLVLLVTGSSLLTVAVDSKNTIPLGTFITWVALMSLPLTVFWSSVVFRKPSTRFQKMLSGALKIIIALAVLWLPLSFLLSGNWAFNFSERATFQGGQTAMKLFWYLCYGIPIFTLIILLLHGISFVFKGRK